MSEIQIIVADYSSKNPDSFLAYLEELSKHRQDGGLLHGGHIHFIQCGLTDDEGFDAGFTLKAAIYQILERVPDIFPLDLPEQAEKDPDLELTEEQINAFNEINEGLIIPVSGHDVLQVIKKAREYAGKILDD